MTHGEMMTFMVIYLSKFHNVLEMVWKWVTIPCFSICNCTIFSMIFGFNNIIMLVGATYSSCPSVVIKILNCWKSLTKNYFPLGSSNTRQIMNPILEYISIATNVDLYADTIINFFTKVSEGGINHNEVYRWIYIASCQFRSQVPCLLIFTALFRTNNWCWFL